MPLKSASRHAPISRWVYTPAWGPYASHDVPLKGAVSGEMTIKITTITETCVGGARNGPDVRPFRLHADGPIAIPASTLDGLLRSTLEVATFGRLGEFVEKRWPGIRDIGGQPGATVKKRYSERMVEVGFAGRTADGDPIRRFTSKVKAGWLLKQDGTVNLIPCTLGRVDIRAVKQHFGMHEETAAWDSLAEGGNTTPVRYGLLGFDPERPFDDRFSFSVDAADVEDHEHRGGRILINERRHTSLSEGPIDATLVVTGKPDSIGNPYGMGKKKREFLFSNPSRRQLISSPVGYNRHSNFPDETLAAFKYLTSRSDGGRSHAAWTFWEPFFDIGEPVPVFYIEEGNAVTAMGMAQMFKAAFGANTHDLLKNSSPEHLVEQSMDRLPDFPSTLLGEAAFYAKDDNGAQTTGRAGRVTFTPARAASINGAPIRDEVELKPRSLTLSSPKEGYYPLYVRQDEYAPPNSKPMATFVNVTYGQETREFVRNPELAGTKIWPAGNGETREQVPDQDQGFNEDGGGGSTIFFLPTGTTFKGRIVFHNVLPQELGAVVWALTAGGEGNETPIIRLGTAKAYGCGEVKVELTDLTTTVGDMANLETARASFVAHMQEVVEASGFDGAWDQTRQVQAVLESRKGGLELSVMNTIQHAEERHAQRLLDIFPSTGWEFEKASRRPTTPPVVEPELDEVPSAGTAVTVRQGATGSHAVRIGQHGIVGDEPLTSRKKLMIYFGNEKQPASVPFKDLRIL